MDKLTMAHEMACAMMAGNSGYNVRGAITSSWSYVDAMQDEADKREVKGVPESVLNSTKSSQLDLSLITHDIDCYFDNSNNTKRDADNLIQSIYEQLTGEFKATDLSEWQPDWSQAPEWAYFWSASHIDGKAYWFSKKGHEEAPSFSYQGDWKDSLRKRPEGK